MTSLSRRLFLKQTAAAAVSVALPMSAGAAEPAQDLPIIDTHQHLWDLNDQRLPWLEGAPAVLRRTYSMSDYLEATRGLNVVKAVYMEVDVAPDEQVAEAERLLKICQQGDNPTVAAVISGRPNTPGFKPYIARFQNNPRIKGVRQVLHAPSAARGLCLEPQFVASMRLLGEMNLSFDLCMRPTEISDGAKLVALAPETQFILDHCGNAAPAAFLPIAKQTAKPSHDPDAWRRDVELIAKHDNVVCKISGIVASVPEQWDAELLAPIVNHCLDTFGMDRVIFGGDWPVCLLGASYAQWVGALRDIVAERPLADQRKLFHDNAVRLYRLA